MTPDFAESSCNSTTGDCDLWKWYYNLHPVGSDDCTVTCTDGVHGSCVVNGHTSDDSADYSGNYRYQEEGKPTRLITDVDECRHAVMQLENEEYVSVTEINSTVYPYGCIGGKLNPTYTCGPQYYVNMTNTQIDCSPDRKCVTK